MKQFIIFCLLLLGLTSCKTEVDVTFNQAEVTQIYAIEDETGNLKAVELEYPIENETELFCLYTCYQNHLPDGYSSPANPNVELISSSIDEGCISYVVNNFIFLSDLEKFHQALSLTGKQFGYTKFKLFFNEKQLI